MKTLKVSYVIEMEDKVFDGLLKDGTEVGHGFNDAGPIETVRRYLVNSGLDAIPEDKFVAGKDFRVITENNRTNSSQ